MKEDKKFLIIQTINEFVDEEGDFGLDYEEIVEEVCSKLKGVREEDVWEILKYEYDVETEEDYYGQLDRENPR